MFSERASTLATYPKPSRSTFPFEIGGGVMLSRRVAIRASYSRTVYDDAVTLVANIPDPEFLGAAVTATGRTATSLERKESAGHISLVVVPVRTDRTRWRLLFGPSFFSYGADMVRDVAFSSDLARPQTTVTITGFTSDRASARAAGVHVGADFEYVLTRLWGITAGARYDDAIVTLEREPLSNLAQRIRVGGVHIMAGFRIHPGR